MRQRRWIELIKDYDLQIHYHPGKANVVANALSRQPCQLNSMIAAEQPSLYEEFGQFRLELVSEGYLASIELQPTLISQIKEAQKGNARIDGIKSQIAAGKAPGFTKDEEGVLWYNGRLCVPSDSELMQVILKEAHDTLYSIHPRGTKMYQDLKEKFWWHGMKREIGSYIAKKRTPDEAEELLAKISKNHDDWSTPEPTPTPILKKRGMIELNDEDMREAKKSLMEKGIKSEDVKNLPPIEDLCKIIPPSSTIEDPLYPEGHPKRIEQDSQRTKETSSPSKKKKKKHKTVVESSEPVNDPNSISISDAETESGNEHDEDNDNNDTPDKEEIEKEPEKHAKNKKKGWSVTENELNAYIEREGHHARDDTEEAEEHLDSSSDAASSSYQHYGHVEPPRHSSAQGPYYHSMYDPPAWNPDPRWG
ncbi:hypothetical protein QYE76_031421 [Lolium multiflorum]|uniref:Integrase zinc-binding domain-containing protein n=1 Tax=Lolium multiflorum TaxID=4521 RepID=A0AAD8QRN0_LOLMU|nr:hypothetical protein QYE76_031421 [Lolium multiflorum]